MRIRNLLTFLLVLCLLVTLFAACAVEEEPVDSGDLPANTDPGTEEPDDAETEITEIEFYWRDMGNVGSSAGTPAVEEAVNKLTEEKIGVHVNFTWIANADYATQVSLAVANGEQVDIVSSIPVPAASFQVFEANGVFAECTSYLDAYGQDIKETVGEELLRTTTVDGKIMAIPVFRNLNSSTYLCFRVDVLEQIGMTDFVDTMTTWAEYEQVLQAIKDNCDMYGTGTGNATLFIRYGGFCFGEKFTDSYRFDTLGDTLGVVWADQEGNIEIASHRPESVEMCKMGADWMSKGLVYPDSPYSDNGLGTEALCGQNVFGAYTTGSEFGVDVNQSQLVGMPMKCVKIIPGVISTSIPQSWTIGLGATTKEPEAAMRFLNLLYTDADLMNLLVYGIEGENYILEDGVANYPAGTDGSTCGYHGMSFSIGNQFLLHPWGAEGEGFYAASFEDFQTATKSIYLGLAISTAEHDTLVAAIGSVRDQYWPQLSCGMYTDELYAEYLAKLDAAGVEDYIALYQAAAAEFMG